LETAIDVLVGELRVGAHPAAAFDVAAHETAGAVAGACRAVAARARLGADVAAGLRGIGETSVLQAHWERLAVCWQLAADHGLAMSALVQAAQRDIAERQRFSDQVRSAMAGARATAAILASLPLFSVVMGQLIGARPMAFLLGGQLGGCLLVVGLTLVCGGLLWSDRITDQAMS
jgi:tight adherence protein B